MIRAPRFLFTSVPPQGHFFPTLCVASALARRGADVTFAAYDDKAEQVAAAVAFRSLGAGPPAAAAEWLAAALTSIKKTDVPVERRAPRVGSIIFPFYEEHMYATLLAVAEEMAAAPDKGGRASGGVVIVCEHGSLFAHDVAEALSLPLVLLWQLPLFYALTIAGESRAAIWRDRRVPVELPGAVLPARMSLAQRLWANPRLKRRQAAVLADAYVPARRAARARSGADRARGTQEGKRWRGDAPFAPAAEALPRPVLHIVSGTWLLEPRAARRHALPPGWHLSGPQGVDLAAAAGNRSAAGGGGEGQPQRQQSTKHHPAVAALLAEAERAAAPVIYVAFGTLFNFDNADTVGAMARAFAALSARGTAVDGNGRAPGAAFVIWSLPPAGQAFLPADLKGRIDVLASPKERPAEPAGDREGSTPRPAAAAAAAARFLVVPRAEQQLLLSHPSVRLFVSHCGLNSTCEALARGVPLVAWPLFADQFVNAAHAVNEGVGVLVPDDGFDGDGSGAGAGAAPGGGTRRDAAAIERIVRGALADAGMASRARALGEALRSVEKGGADVAADLVLAEFGGGFGCGMISTDRSSRGVLRSRAATELAKAPPWPRFCP